MNVPANEERSSDAYRHKNEPSSNLFNELYRYFKLNNLLTGMRNEQKHYITISNIIMDIIIDKKLGSITYHYGNKKSKKAYHTYNYPEIYYNRKLYYNITQFINTEFYKKI